LALVLKNAPGVSWIALNGSGFRVFSVQRTAMAGKTIVIRYRRILQGRKASVKSGCKICGWRPPAKLHPLFGDHAEMPFDGAPSHLQLICACRCHSQPVPMRRISEDGTRRDIFGGMRVARVSDGTTPAMDAFLSNKLGAERQRLRT
jgi:hypothetical protein